MNNKIYKVTQLQLQSLQTQGFITVNGVRYNYDPNSIYILADPFAPEYRLANNNNNLNLTKDGVVVSDLKVNYANISSYASNTKNLQSNDGTAAYTYNDVKEIKDIANSKQTASQVASAISTELAKHAGIDKVGTVTKVNNVSPDANGNVTIAIPTKTSELTNDSFVTTATAQNIDGNKIFRGDYTYLETKDIKVGKTVYDRRNIGDAPQILSFMNSSRTTGGYYNAVIYSGAGDWLYGAHLKENFDIRSSFKGDGSENDTYDSNLGYTHTQLDLLTDWRYTTGWHILANKVTSTTPAIIQIKFTTLLYTDVLRLIMTGHTLKDPSGGWSGFLDDYTIEICTDYTNDTWVTVVNRTNANDNLGLGLIYGLQLNTVTKCYGIRLKITKCHITGTGYQFINITTMQLRDYRPAFTVPDSLGAVSQLGGDVWGKLRAHGDLETGHLYPREDNRYNLGSTTNKYLGVFSAVFYENGQTLSNKYLGKKDEAASSASLDGYPASNYLRSIKINGTTKPSTNSTVDLGNVCTYTNAVVESKLDIASRKMEEVKWDDLKFLRDSGKLEPGMSYRITDYTTTTNPSQTTVKSAGHQFDIVVTADGKDTLNENARAMLHSGDTYFKDCDLSSWKLKYCLDNDRSRFYWAADEKEGKGVIYWMEDEFHNQVPYDFKNIMYKRYKVNSVGRNNTILFDNFFCESSNLKITDCISPTSLFGDMASIDDGTFIWCYTFCTFGNDNASNPLDASINLFPDGVTVSNYRVRPLLYAFNNIIEPYIVGNGDTNTTKTNYQQLNNIVFMKYNKDSSADNQHNFSVYGNRIKSACASMTFGRGCSRNTFDNCNNMMFGFGCIGNTVSGCTRSVFSYKCSGNSGEQGFGYNLLCNTCQYNRFAGMCQYLELGEKSLSNTFGNGCKYLIVGMSGNSKYNTFEDNVSYVKIDANSSGNDPLQYITIGKGVAGVGEGSSMLMLLQPRGLTHTVTYRKFNSETIDI